VIQPYVRSLNTVRTYVVVSRTKPQADDGRPARGSSLASYIRTGDAYTFPSPSPGDAKIILFYVSRLLRPLRATLNKRSNIIFYLSLLHYHFFRVLHTEQRNSVRFLYMDRKPFKRGSDRSDSSVCTKRSVHFRVLFPAVVSKTTVLGQ